MTLDCPDAKELSTFYAKLLGKPVTYEGEGVAMIGEDGAQPVMFQQIAEYHAPRWPDPAYPQQFHLDVTVDDVDAAEAEDEIYATPGTVHLRRRIGRRRAAHATRPEDRRPAAA